MLVAGCITSQPWEGFNVRSRLWALILRELPFPFRDIGMELARLIKWIDQTAARFWIGLSRSPAWYLVTATGVLAFLLTGLLFFNYVATHDPTLKELANRRGKIIPVTREHLEDAGDWAAQDKWRVAHFFVDHRPPKHNRYRTSDVVLNDFDPGPSFAAAEPPRKSGFRSRLHPSTRKQSIANSAIGDADVMLELGTPRVAEVPKRLVDGRLVREAGTNSRNVRTAALRSREPELVVQAEWALGPDCDYEPVRRPGRRIIPVPEPQWDELPPVVDHRHPDLSFQMVMLREFLPPTGEFPPGSRFASVSVSSEFPESITQPKRRNPLLDEFSPWTEVDPNQVQPERPVESYAERMGPEEDSTPIVDDLDRDLRVNPAPSFAEVALGLEIRAPKSAVAGSASHSSILLYNNGAREIPLISVREPLATLETITDAIPPARVDQFDNSLERKVQRLEPGKSSQLELVWRADSLGRRTHSAFVTAMAAVGTLTEIVPPVGEQPMPSIAPEPIPAREPPVEPEPAFEPIRQPEPVPEPVPVPAPVPVVHPKLSFDVQSLPRVRVDDVVEIAIVVRNTGDVPLHRVRVVAQLPEQLKHRQGNEVEYTINTLPVKGTERTVLRVVAQKSGQAICQLQVSATEPASAESRAVIEVNAKPAPPAIVKSEPPRTKSPQPTPLRQNPVTPSSNCCCQSEFMVYDPWYIP